MLTKEKNVYVIFFIKTNTGAYCVCGFTKKTRLTRGQKVVILNAII